MEEMKKEGACTPCKDSKCGCDAMAHGHKFAKCAIWAILFMFVFWLGVQVGEIKGAVGATNDHHFSTRMQGGYYMKTMPSMNAPMMMQVQ